MDFIGDHLDRIETALLKGYSLSTAAKWIVEKTFLKGEPYSYVDHEFQERIAGDLAIDVIVRKCSQIGLSELSTRIALAYCNTMPGFTTIYTLPTANFAKTFAKTRIDPIIDGSPFLKDRIDREMDSAEVKKFLDSFLYIKGTVGAKAAISVPADCLIHDELDFSDEEVVSQYESRFTHSKFKMKRKFSTPTVNGVGVSEEFDSSRKHWNFVKCCHCNHQFIPDYFKHVRIPGYDGDIRRITKENLWKIHWREAYLECPSCSKQPDLSPAYREWVVENDDLASDKHGYQIQPFDAPKIITPADLVKASTKYVRYADFVNFNLGLPCEDAETSFSEEELKALFMPRAAAFEPYAAVMGIDMGLMCHVMIGGLGPDGLMDILCTMRVPQEKLEEKKAQLAALYRVRVTVMDSQPYYDMLTRMQTRDPNLWGAVYSQKKDLELMNVVDHEKDEETGQERVRQVDVNRNLGFDAVMGFVRQGGLAIRDQSDKELVMKHMKDMKRVKNFDANDELVFKWKKSASGQDHYHHALLYTYIAARLIGTATTAILLPFGVQKVKLEQKFDANGRPLGTAL